MVKFEKFNSYMALLSEMENGRRVSLIESQILFGVQSFNRDLTRDNNDCQVSFFLDKNGILNTIKDSRKLTKLPKIFINSSKS